MALDPEKVHAFVGKAVGDLGAAASALLVVVGDKLGLYRALKMGPATSDELAHRANLHERYVREWLAAQASAGYVTYDAAAGRYFLSDEQAECMTNEESPACVVGGFQSLLAVSKAVPKVMEGFRTGKGVGWHEHDADLFHGTERFFRPGYNANLVSSWIPSLEGVKQKLESGAEVADVGCGHGASTIILAKAYPKSRFHGFDYHQPSIDAAKQRAQSAGVGDRVTFERAAAADYPGKYDLVAFFDCLHDMGDPVGAAGHVKDSLRAGGTWMLVEPFAHDKVEDNLNPIGRVMYGFSTMVCCPASLAQEGRAALGAQAGEARMRDVMKKAGFGHFRRATETPFNIVYEIRA
jgi:2-polyprenyl-3-methyl-5-hydroxy-6-metoxy-1,4-benzoquinol methylase